MKSSTINIILSTIIGILIAVIFFCRPEKTANKDDAKKSLGISDLIDKVKSELVASQENQVKKGQIAMFLVDSFDLQIKFTVNKSVTNDGHVQFNFASAGTSESKSNELVQTITLHMKALPAVVTSHKPSPQPVINRKTGKLEQPARYVSNDDIPWYLITRVKNNAPDSISIDLSHPTKPYDELKLVIAYNTTASKQFHLDTLLLSVPSHRNPDGKYRLPIAHLPKNVISLIGIDLLTVFNIPGGTQYEFIKH